MPKFRVKRYDGIKMYYRPGTSDERVMREVIEKRCYRRPSIGFEVEAGERWLDLGANIGAFAVYCAINDAEAVCYEPEISCFQLLELNVPQFECVNAAVTSSGKRELEFWMAKDEKNLYRGSCVPSNRREVGKVHNRCGAFLKKQRFDGVKIDIEGSEGGLIDYWMLPQANKLCVEYHLSRDQDLDKLRRRVAILNSHYQTLSYSGVDLRKLMEGSDKFGRTWNDRIIFCKGLR